MKLSTKQLKQIIKEEMRITLNEWWDFPDEESRDKADAEDIAPDIQRRERYKQVMKIVELMFGRNSDVETFRQAVELFELLEDSGVYNSYQISQRNMISNAIEYYNALEQYRLGDNHEAMAEALRLRDVVLHRSGWGISLGRTGGYDAKSIVRRIERYTGVAMSRQI